MTAPRQTSSLSSNSLDLRTLAASLFDELRHATGDGVGITRESYGVGEQKAVEIIKAFAERHGLPTEWDAAANLVITLPGRKPNHPFIACGSHLDSVPHGGNYDGAAGVIAGLLSIVRMHSEGVVPPHTIKVIGLRGEESAWFGKAYVGSSALFGQLTKDDLALTDRKTGRSLADCMRERGADINRIARGERLLDPKDVAAYLELHIEQGPVMVSRDLPTAIVTGIRGNVRHKNVVCLGEAGHSGAVPRWLRRDAVFAIAELIGHVDEHWRVLLERGLDLVVTVGMIGTNPEDHAISRIPGEVRFSFEARSQDTYTLEAFYNLFRAECERITKTRKVQFRLDRRLDSSPARMDEGWIERLIKLSDQLGLPMETVASGAGHDAAVFANAGIPAAMIFVRNKNGSHNPYEAMELDDFAKGTELLYHALLE